MAANANADVQSAYTTKGMDQLEQTVKYIKNDRRKKIWLTVGAIAVVLTAPVSVPIIAPIFIVAYVITSN